MGLKVFISGAGGYLGSVLASQLASMPEIDNITGIDTASRPSALPEKVKFITMDIRSPELADAMSGHDLVIHTAGIVQWRAEMPEEVRDDINLNGTRNIAQAAVKNRVRGFLQASSVTAYDHTQVQGKEDLSEDTPIGNGDSPMYYWNSKSLAERILSDTLASSKIALTLFRIGTIVGPSRPSTVQNIRENAVLITGHNPRTQYIHENDVAQAFMLAIRTDMPGAFNVVTDGFIRMSEVYNIIGVEPTTVPLWKAQSTSFFRWRYQNAPLHPSWIQSFLIIDFTLSNAKLKAAGWKPAYKSAEAIRTAL